MGDGAAVDGDEDVLPLGGADKAHVVPQPALHAAALVVIGAGALGLIPVAALEAVHVEIPHIGADALEVFDEFVVGRHGGTPFLGGGDGIIIANLGGSVKGDGKDEGDGVGRRLVGDRMTTAIHTKCLL